MIDLYYWPTPNGHKITMFLEETGMPYTIVPVNIGKGEQFTPEFLAISPNNRMPAIVDHAPLERGAPISVFESGAILLVSGGEERACSSPATCAAGVEVIAMAVLAGGRAGPHGRAEPSFFADTRRRKFPMPSSATSRKPTACMGCSNKRLGRPRIRRRRVLHRGHGGLSLDRAARDAGPEPRGFPALEALVRDDQRRGRPPCAPTSASRRTSQQSPDHERRSREDSLRSDGQTVDRQGATNTYSRCGASCG